MSLDLAELTAEEQAFADALTEAGIPTTSEATKAEFDNLASSAGLNILNTSTISPFWRFVQAVAITPWLWLVAFLVRSVMPNLFAKTAKSYWLDLIAWAYGIERKDTAFAKGQLRFTRDSVGQELIIPKGTIVRTVAINGTVYRMIVDEDTAFPTNQTWVLVAVTAEEAGGAYNLAQNYYSILASPIVGVTGVINDSDWLISPGADAEEDEALRLRLRNQFTAVSDWHTDAKYKAMIAKNISFSVDRIFFDHDIPRGPGSADAYVVFDAAVVAQPYLDQVNNYVSAGNHGHGDDMQVKAMPTTSHDFTIVVHPLSSLTGPALTARLAEVEQFIRCAFRENSDYDKQVTKVNAWSRFSVSNMEKELHNAFFDIASYDIDLADIISVMAIPRIGSLTVTAGAV